MMEGTEEFSFDWGSLVPHMVHPLKVAIVEALLWIGVPISASELTEVFEGEFSLSLIAYHVKKLAEAGVLAQVQQRQVRGATQRFYFFSTSG